MADHSKKRKRVSATARRDGNASHFALLEEQNPELGLLVSPGEDSEHRAYDSPESDESDASEHYSDNKSEISTSESEEDSNDQQGNHIESHESSEDEEKPSNGCVEPFKAYKESQECWPVSPIFDIEIGEVVLECNNIASVISKRLNKTKADRSGLVGNYISEATKVASGYQSKPIVIGLFGKTGSGKSETVNSILDKPGLAKAMSAGEACTAVAIEYTAAMPGQTKLFKAQVHFFDTEKRSTLLQEQIETFFFYLSIRPKYGRDDKDKDLELAWKPRYSTAIKTFRALFCDIKHFRSDRSTEKYMKERGRKALKAIHKDMVIWCDKLLQEKTTRQPHTVDKEYVGIHEHGTIKALRKAIDPFTSSSTVRRKAALWPLVEKVSIACKDSRVLEGAIIADLPGVADTNRVRVQAARRYIMQCDYLVIVAEINRICDDSTVLGLLDEYVDRFRGSIVIIGTKSDLDISPALVDHFKARKSHMNNYHALEREARSKSHDLKELRRKAKLDGKAELEQVVEPKKNIKESSSSGSLPELDEKPAKLQEELHPREQMQLQKETELLQQIENIEVQQFEFIVDLRNKKIESDLRQSTKTYTHKGKYIPIFPISNTHYAAAKGCNKARSPCLSPEATGIPRLRKYLLELTVSNRTKAFNSHVDYTCGALIRGLQVWTAGAKAKDSDHPRPRLKEVRSKLVDVVDTKSSNITKLVDEQLRSPLHDRQVQVNVAKESPAIIAKMQAKEWRWNTIKSFVRYHGKNDNSVKPGINWNKQFSRLATSDVILLRWKGMRDKFDTELIDIEREFQFELESIGSTLYSDPDAQHLPLNTFAQLLAIIVKEVSNDIRGYVEANDKKILNIQLQAIIQAEFFTQAMESVYTACVAMRGRGVKRRILDSLRAYILYKGPKSPFAMLGDKIADELNHSFQEFLDQSEQAVDSALQKMDRNFENLITSQDKADRDLAQRAKIREFLVEQKIEERYLALLAKRDAIFAKPEYTNVSIKQEEIHD